VVLQQPSPHKLVIGGMTCAACAARVQAKLNRLDGVTASVNLSTERAWVSAPPNLSPHDLIDVVEAAGYTTEVAPLPADAGPGVSVFGRPRFPALSSLARLTGPI
jgi:Cu+-exporting ATPase